MHDFELKIMKKPCTAVNFAQQGSHHDPKARTRPAWPELRQVSDTEFSFKAHFCNKKGLTRISCVSDAGKKQFMQIVYCHESKDSDLRHCNLCQSKNEKAIPE